MVLFHINLPRFPMYGYKTHFMMDVISGDMADNLSRCDDLVAKFVDTKSILPELPASKLRTLLVELDMLVEKWDREMSIMYVSGNYTSSSHLCTMVLRGKSDDEIREIMASVRADLLAEIEKKNTL